MKKLYILTSLLIALAVSANAQPKFGVPTAFQKTINDLLSKIPINIAGNSIKLSFEGDTWRGQLNGQDLLAGVFKIDEGPDGAIITIKQSFLYADTGKKVPITGKPIAAWVDTPGPELFFEYKKGPPMSILPTSQEAATAAIAAIAAIKSGAAAAPAAAAPKTQTAAPSATAAAPTQTSAAATPALPAAQAATAQPSDHDTLVMVSGVTIDADIQEITPTQIKYKSPGYTGLYIVNKKDVLSINHKSGVVEVINTPENIANKPRLDPSKLYVGFSLEPSGFISGGPSVTLEFSKGTFNSSVHASFPTLALNSTASGFGFGAGAGLSYYWSGPIGGFFVGGVIEWNMFPYPYTVYNPYAKYNTASDTFVGDNVTEDTFSHSFILALQGGYRFVLKNGFYFRTGIAAGMTFSTFFPSAFYYKPDIATGYLF